MSLSRFRQLIPFLLLACAPPASAQRDILMARDNVQLSLAAAPVNLYEEGVNNALGLLRNDLAVDEKYAYTASFLRPLSLQLSYAISNYTAIGVTVHYFSFGLEETRTYANGGETTYKTNGSQLALTARGTRYFYQTRNSTLYLFGEAGVETRSVSYESSNGKTPDVAYINAFPISAPDPKPVFAYDLGAGLKIRVFKTVGVLAELSRISPLGRFGLFYTFLPAGRRSKDDIGW